VKVEQAITDKTVAILPVHCYGIPCDVEALQNAKEIKYEEISKFPEVRRDLALVIDDSISFAEIENLAYQTEKKFLKKNITLFDVYKGEKLPQGKKQYALSFTLQDNEKTLNDKQIESIMNKLLKSFEEKLGAKLR
jgi:phenylalanyl-tRNA synthetase beta chain